jgi:GTPase Era involved in 16S rRNA processing
MKFKIEMIVHKEDFVIPGNKSKSMINALQREQILELVQQAVPNSYVISVRKVQEEGVCT